MSLHADVAVPARDRRRLERLCRYVARPPLASERLEERPNGRLALRLKARWRDGTTHILMERSELIERLVPLIPPPRAHQVRYHGILALSASMRDRIVPQQSARPPDGAWTECVPGSRPPATDGSRTGPDLSSASEERRRRGGRSSDESATSTPPSIESLGDHTLIGEITDAKCFLGVMKPGFGKTHRACAVRCISGGIPPIFVTRDVEGKATVYLLTDADHGAINDDVLSYVSEPVELAGRLERHGDLLVYAIDPSKIVRR